MGPQVLGIRPLDQLQINFLLGWKAGEYLTWDLDRSLGTYEELQDKLQWKGQYSADLRVGKQISGDKANVQLFMEVTNVFNLKYISMQGFAAGDDWRSYLESLHLPMYRDEQFEAAGYTGGNDRVGDRKSDDKPYINMPNRNFLTYLNPRRITLGLRINF